MPKQVRYDIGFKNMTLTEATYYFRKYLPFAVAAFLMLLIIFYSFKLLFEYISGLEKKDVVILKEIEGIEGFSLEKPQFSGTTVTDSQGIKFTLDTPEGSPIVASEAATVYYVPPMSGKIENKSKAESMVGKSYFGFDKTMQKKVDSKNNKYVFSDTMRKLEIDLTNFNFTYKYEMKKDANLFAKSKMISKKDLEDKATEFLKTMGKYPEELAQGQVNVIYIDYDQVSDTSTIVKRPQDANLVEVDFFRSSFGDTQIATPTFFNSQNYVMLIPEETDYKLVAAQVRFFEKSNDLVGNYALKTGAEAWEELTAGNGSVVFNEGEKKTATIRKMQLRYYDPEVYQQTIQPVFVFLGDNFAAYVPALKESYFQTEAVQSSE